MLPCCYFFYLLLSYFTATIEMMQEPEISLEAGMQPDEMVDELGAILGKYEVPMGLMNKRKSFEIILLFFESTQTLKNLLFLSTFSLCTILLQ